MTSSRPPWITDQMQAQALDSVRLLDSYEDDEDQYRRRLFQERWGLSGQLADAAWAEDPALRIHSRGGHEHSDLLRDAAHQQMLLTGDVHQHETALRLDLQLRFGLTAEQADTLWHWAVIQDGHGPPAAQTTAAPTDTTQATPAATVAALAQPSSSASRCQWWRRLVQRSGEPPE